MSPTDYIVIGIIVLIIGAATAYIIKAKKSGKKCIGCPDGASCSAMKNCQGSCAHCSGCSRCDAQDSE